jgi:hypothetical protein
MKNMDTDNARAPRIFLCRHMKYEIMPYTAIEKTDKITLSEKNMVFRNPQFNDSGDHNEKHGHGQRPRTAVIPLPIDE